MKKLFTLFLTVALLFVVVGCSTENYESVDVKIVVPFGGPGITHIKMMKEKPVLLEGSNYEIEIVKGSDPLVAAFTSKSHDIIIAPTNLGAKLYNNSPDYIFAANIVWGANYLVSTEEDFTWDSLKGKEILAFGKNATPDVVLQSVLKEKGLLDEVTIRYVASVSDVQVELITGNATIGLLAEPIVSVTKTKKPITTLDLQEGWKDVTGENIIPQAGIFVSKELYEKNPTFVKKYLDEVAASIKFANEDLETLASYSDEIKFGLPGAIVKQATVNSNLKYVSAIDSKASLELYFEEIMELNPKLIGDKLPEEDFYLK